MTFANFKQKLSPGLLAVLMVGYVTMIGTLIAIRLITKIPVHYLTRDTLTTAGGPFYLGAFSNLGILFWCAAATICFFTFAILKNSSNKKDEKLFFQASGLLTSFLLIDDFFLIHEQVFPLYLNIPEKYFYAGYAIVISLYLLKFGRKIAKTQFLPLLLAFGFFAFSVLCDSEYLPLPPYLLKTQPEALLEDGSKLLGIFSWFLYFANESMEQLKYYIFGNNDVNGKSREYNETAIR